MRGSQFGKTFLLVVLAVATRGEADSRTKIDPALILISARDQIPGSFLSDQTIFADRERIYLAAYQRQLFVLARDRASNFPLIQTVEIGAPLTAVRGDQSNIYVLAGDGYLRIFSKTFPLKLTAIIAISDLRLDSLAAFGLKTYVSLGQGEMVVDQRRVYLSALNEGDVGLMLKKGKLTDLIYGSVFSPWVTMVYDRKTGATIGQIANPIGSQVALVGDRTRLYQTVPGCCGAGIFVYDKDTLTLNQFIPRPATNTVTAANQPGEDLLIGGTEGGSVDLFDLSRGAALLVSNVDLRTATGHTGSEDIEIRALWADGLDDLVFAASSWGNDNSRSPGLPSFFVLQIR